MKKCYCGNPIKYGKTYCSLKCVANAPEIIAKREATNIQKYGCKNPFSNKNIQNKIKISMKNNYGVSHPSQSIALQTKKKNTLIERYGVDHNSKIPKVKIDKERHCESKYGCKNPSQSPIIKQKKKDTCKKHYGVESYIQTVEGKKRILETKKSRYGEHYCFSNPLNEPQRKLKEYITKKKNHTFNASQQENMVYDLLMKIFDRVEKQYRSEQYPFACDFYIPSRDLYIECNFHWTHAPRNAREFYDRDNPIHQLELKKWQDKAVDSKFYAQAIKVWTDLDIRKLDMVKKNKLNYLAFYKIQDCLAWLNRNGA